MERALQAIERIYDAALEPARWPSALVAVVDYVGGSKGLLFTPLTNPKDGGFAIPHSVSQSLLAQWEARYLEHDVWARAGELKQVYRDGNVVLDVELVPEEEFRRSVVYRELLGPSGIARLCCGIVFGTASRDVLPTVCSVYRDIGEPAFGNGERERMHLLIPHLSRAFGITYRLRDAEFKLATTLSALDRLPGGVLLLGEQRQVVFANRAARRMLDERDGLELAGSPARLVTAAPDRTAELDAALTEALQPATAPVAHFSSGIRIPRISGRSQYVVNAAALPSGSAFDAERARGIVFLADPLQPVAQDAPLLQRIYSLSEAEIRVLQHVCAGRAPREVAAHLGLSENTIRTHLRHVFEKTGTARQSELVRLMLSLSAASAPAPTTR